MPHSNKSRVILYRNSTLFDMEVPGINVELQHTVIPEPVVTSKEDIIMSIANFIQFLFLSLNVLLCVLLSSYSPKSKVLDQLVTLNGHRI